LTGLAASGTTGTIAVQSSDRVQDYKAGHIIDRRRASSPTPS
jgi:hypothetical protein